MLRILAVLSLILFFALLSCKNIVKKYDNYVHKSYQRNDFVSQTVQLDKHEVFFYDNKRENAPVLLFIHGFGGDGKISWKDQALKFGDDYRVIIPDILWFGNSKSEESPQLQTQIDAISSLISHLSIAEVHLVGISYGGFISLGIAQQHQEKLATLTIVDSPGVHFTDEELQAFCDKIGVANVADAFLPQNSEEVKRMLNFAFGKAPRLPSGIREQTIGIYLSKNPKEQRKMLEDLPENRMKFKELAINIPVLILWGEDDEIFLTSDAKELQAQLGAELIIIPKAGHGLPVERPKAFNNALRSFIERDE
ncbi:MAG TPA: alpha/beta hydrolase [Brumimicrobium sp.]|nr:alpha/beta hydrolase [Brumimicrobium sp.]